MDRQRTDQTEHWLVSGSYYYQSINSNIYLITHYTLVLIIVPKMGRNEKTGKDLSQMGYPVESVATYTHHISIEMVIHKIPVIL